MSGLSFLHKLVAKTGIISLILILTSSCYALRQVASHSELMRNAQDIEPLLARNDEMAMKIRFILEVKKFAEERLGLAKTQNYTRYLDLKGVPINYSLYVCKPDSFEILSWSYPIVGKFNYRGYFDPEEAKREKKRFESEGYDVALYPNLAYSTLGYFRDPILSTMLEHPRHELADLIIHELVHSTVYSSKSSDFNESLASFIAAKGSLEFLKERYPDEVEAAIRSTKQSEQKEKLIGELHDILDVLYKSKLSKEKKLEMKAVVLEHYKKLLNYRSLNNAVILAGLTYNDNDLYEPIFKKLGWKEFVELTKKAAVTDNPKKYLSAYQNER